MRWSDGRGGAFDEGKLVCYFVLLIISFNLPPPSFAEIDNHHGQVHDGIH